MLRRKRQGPADRPAGTVLTASRGRNGLPMAVEGIKVAAGVPNDATASRRVTPV
jgi:hypothetical protein